MRKILGPILLGLGGFFLTAALLALVWVPGQVKKTPLDVDSLTQLSGEASYLGSPRGPVKATSHSVTDGDASTGAVAVFQSFSCLMWNKDGAAPDCVSADGADSQLINAGTDNFATDRKTALSMPDQEKFVGANASPHEGLINKFPFDVEKKTYPFWDGILDRAVDATFQGEEKIDGLDTYKFVIDVVDQPAEISSGVQGTYTNNKTLWIDARTGSIVKQVEKQVRTLPNGDAALDMDLAFTDEQVAANVKDGKANGSKLGLVDKLPWIAGLLGLLSLAAGLLLMRGRDDDVAVHGTEREVAPERTTRIGTEGATATGRDTVAGRSTVTPRRPAGEQGTTEPDVTRPIPQPDEVPRREGGPLFGSREPGEGSRD